MDVSYLNLLWERRQDDRLYVGCMHSPCHHFRTDSSQGVLVLFCAWALPLSTGARPKMLQWTARSQETRRGVKVAWVLRARPKEPWWSWFSGFMGVVEANLLTMAFRKSWQTDGSTGLLPVDDVPDADKMLSSSANRGAGFISAEITRGGSSEESSASVKG